MKTTNKQRILNLVLGLAFDDHRKSTLQLARPIGTFVCERQRKRESQWIIELPMKVWDGNWSDKLGETQTTVYVFPLCNAIEKAIENVIKQYERGEIQCVISDIEEVKTRFTILQSY